MTPTGVHPGPAGRLARLATAWIRVPFPWVLGEAHAVKVVTKTGTTFDHEIAVAVPTPRLDSSQLVSQAVLGAFVGIVPVAIGLMFYPALRGVGSQGHEFPARADHRPARLPVRRLARGSARTGRGGGRRLPGPVMVVLAASVSFLLLWLIGRRRGAPTGLALATYIALGIGLHNLGEGLAIGAAFAAGAAGLGTFLVLGFTLHNITEGIGIAAPMLKEPPPLCRLRLAGPAGRGPGRPRHVARQPRVLPAMVGAGAGDRRRRHSAGHRRGWRSISGVWTTDGKPGRFLSA